MLLAQATPYRFRKSGHPQISIRVFSENPSVNGIIEALAVNTT